MRQSSSSPEKGMADVPAWVPPVEKSSRRSRNRLTPKCKIGNETVTVTIQNRQRKSVKEMPHANALKAMQEQNYDSENQSNRFLFLYRE
jgi:hypothetical protein